MFQNVRASVVSSGSVWVGQKYKYKLDEPKYIVCADKEATQYYSSTTISLARSMHICVPRVWIWNSRSKLRFTIRGIFVSLQASKKVLYRIIVYQFYGKLTFCYFFLSNNEWPSYHVLSKASMIHDAAMRTNRFT